MQHVALQHVRLAGGLGDEATLVRAHAEYLPGDVFAAADRTLAIGGGQTSRVDAVLLETNDGRPHLEQVLPVIAAGKPVFVDKPIAGLLADLKSRGLLDSTLVVWTSEFGRTSYGQSGNGRDHNPWGYTQWLAGGGVRAGYTYGETDAVGLQVADKDKAVDTYDLQATVLQLLGLDHLKTIFLHNGRSERPTVVYGKVVKEVLV